MELWHEIPHGVLPPFTHASMRCRATGTRGKKLVVLVGQAKAIAIAVKNVSGRRRWSKLNEWLGFPGHGVST